MKPAALASLLALTTFSCGYPAFAQAPSATSGPITSQADRDRVAERVRAGASCAGCDLFQINLAYQGIDGRDFSGARIRQADLSLATADRAGLRGANLSLANLFGARLARADLRDANLEGATLVGAFFGGARMSGAALAGANLSGAELALAVGLTQDQLNTACGDETTTLPTGMTMPHC